MLDYFMNRGAVFSLLIIPVIIFAAGAAYFASAQLTGEDREAFCKGLKYCVDLLQQPGGDKLDTDEKAGCAVLLAFSEKDLAQCNLDYTPAAAEESASGPLSRDPSRDNECQRSYSGARYKGMQYGWFQYSYQDGGRTYTVDKGCQPITCPAGSSRDPVQAVCVCDAGTENAGRPIEGSGSEAVGKPKPGISPVRSVLSCGSSQGEQPAEKPKPAPEPEKEQEVIPDEVRLGLLNKDCSVNDDVFDRDWEKYSTINDKQAGSLEVQKRSEALSKTGEKRLEIFFLKRDNEIERQAQYQMRAYRDALVKNIKVNLLKSFWRLAYITFDTIHGTPGLGEGAVGTGKTFSKLFDKDVLSIQKLGAGIKVLRDLTPGDSRLAIDTPKWRGKIQAVGTTAALDTLDTLGDPIEVGKSVAQDIIKQTLPSADITPEEIEILRTQHLDKRALDDVIQESYRAFVGRIRQAEQLEAEVESLQKEADEWKAKEKSRVAGLLQRSCREKTKK